MIDLHSHILPGIDDGASDLAMSLAMAEAYVADGVAVVACTPHILPGLYHSSGPQIRAAVAALQSALDRAGLPLRLTTGADVHIAPDLVGGLRSGRILTLAESRYVLIEPPHHVLPARFEATLFELTVAGYVPIVTHPERLSWIREHYARLQRLADHGVWMQLTAGSITGRLGKSATYWSHRMLDDGLVHIVASDAHDPIRRPPEMTKAREALAARVGVEAAAAMVEVRPRGILENAAPDQLVPLDRGSAELASAVLRRGTGYAGGEAARAGSGALHRIARRLREFIG